MLFVVFAVLAAGWLWQQRSDRVEVLTVRRDVAAGSVIERSDLAIADVAGLADAVPADEADTVVQPPKGDEADTVVTPPEDSAD